MDSGFISIARLILILGIFICGLILWYKKYIGIYSEFPGTTFTCLKYILLKPVSKHTSVNNYYFQYIIDVCTRYQAEGLCFLWMLQPYVFIYGEEALKVFSNENTTINKPYHYDFLKKFVMESLMTSEGDLWKKRRKMLNPVFYSPNLREKSEAINKNAKRLIENMLKQEKESSSYIKKLLQECTFRNIYEFLTGYEVVEHLNNSELKETIECVNEVAYIIANRVFQPWLQLRCISPFFTENHSFLKASKKSLQIAEKIIEDVKESSSKIKYKDEKEVSELCRNSRRSFAQVIIDQSMKDPSYTFKDMQGEIAGLMAAGYDTISYALMWNLFLLGHHPDMQDQVYEEVESVMGLNKEISYDDLEHLKYLECVIKETLRIYPPVPIYARRTEKNVKCGKYTVPKGTTIVFFTYMAHRDPIMFPDPEKFDPDRFLDENSDKKILIYPFSEGIRNCIGKNFAIMELKIILSHIIKNFKVTSLDRREDIKLSWEIMLSTVEPLRLQFTPRRHISVQG